MNGGRGRPIGLGYESGRKGEMRENIFVIAEGIMAGSPPYVQVHRNMVSSFLLFTDIGENLT